jgi:hypothetical protein
MFLGGKSKYDRPSYKNSRIYNLTSIIDGSVRTFVDDGPFEDNSQWHTLQPNGQRQQLIRQLQKRCPGDDSLPLFFTDQPLPDLYHPLIGKISVPVANDAIKSKMAEFAPHVAGRKERGVEAVNSAKKAEEAKAAQQAAGLEMALKNVLGDLAAAKPKAAPKAKKAEAPSE